jgi:hypothetical protein
MDIQTIDQQYQQLQQQSQQTIQALQMLGGKLQAAAQGGDQQAREWLLDLRELALSFKSEQDQMANLLQAIHGFVANQAQQVQPYQAPPQPSAWTQQPYAQPPQGYPPQNYPPQSYPPQSYPPQAYPPPQQGGFGGMLGGFLNSGFGRAMEMGAGLGIGEDLINKIF